MIYSYIEKNILRKIKLVNILWNESYIPISTISKMLSCTINTVNSDIESLNNDLNIPISESKDGSLKISPSDIKSIELINNKIYKNSLFLNCLHHLLSPRKKKFIDFIEEHYISVSRGYMIKNMVENYLNSINLKIVNNHIHGSWIAIRFLYAVLYKNFGIKTFSWNNDIENKTNQMLNKIEKNLKITFSYSEKSFFSALMQTTNFSLSKPKKNTLVHSQTIPFDTLPIGFKDIVKEEFQDFWQLDFELEYEFTKLSFFIMNTHVFDHALEVPLFLQQKREFCDNPDTKDFINQFNKEFQTNFKDESWFLSALYLFLKDLTHNLSGILTTEYTEVGEVDTKLKKKVFAIINKWNVYNINLNDKHINLFCCRIAPFMNFKHRFKKIALLANNILDGQITSEVLLFFFNEKIEVSTLDSLESISKNEYTNTLLLIDKTIFFNNLDSNNNTLFIKFPPTKEDIQIILKKYYE